MGFSLDVELVEIPLGLQLLRRVQLFVSVDILLQYDDLSRLDKQTANITTTTTNTSTISDDVPADAV